MSYDHPTADVNSAGENPDPLTGSRLQEANRRADLDMSNRGEILDYNPLESWQRVTEDILHFTPFDSLPQEDRDRIRARRARNFRNSAIPWIATDYTSLLTAMDDVDDLMKTKTLIKDYALTPAAAAARALRKGENPFKNEKLEGWKEGCDIPAGPREKKLLVPSFGGLNLLAVLGLEALKAFFPGWRLFWLAMQAAQTLDSFFGVGLQLGPVVGVAAEGFFRGLKNLGGPIFNFENKYEQLKAARVLQTSNRLVAASRGMHPHDAFGSLTGFYYASDAQIMPELIIDQGDYPNLADVFDSPFGFAKEGLDFARLAASLPYNLGAQAVNHLLGDGLSGLSEMIGGSGDLTALGEKVDNETAAYMAAIENGICPGGQCEAELAVDALLVSEHDGHIDPKSNRPMSKRELAKNLGMSVEDLDAFIPPPQSTQP